MTLHQNLTKLDKTFRLLTLAHGIFIKIINTMRKHIFLIIAFALLTGSVSAQDNKASVSLAAAMYEEEVTGNLEKAAELYLNILKDYPEDRPVAAKTLYHLGLVNEKMGKQKANEYFTRLVNTYPDQTEMVALAKTRLAALGVSGGTGELVARRVLADASGVDGVLTPDGKYIRYMDQGKGFNDYGSGDVFQFEVVSGKKSRIKYSGPKSETEHPVEFQVFSRDGKQIAYNSVKDSAYPLQIRNLDGSGLRILYTGNDYVQPLDWSPDAGSILALRDRSLNLISTADGSERVLRSNTSGSSLEFQTASFSPDGLHIAFSFVRDGSPSQGDVYLMSVDGRNEVVVAGHPAEDRLLTWTPDGKNLLFLSDRSGTWDLWAVHITGGKQQGEPELLKKDFGRDSKVIGFAQDGSLFYKNYTSSGGLYKGEIDLETGKVLVPPVLVTTRYDGPPNLSRWSPDGSNLLYLSRWGGIIPGNNILTIRSNSTGEERFLSPRLRYVNQISWAPDGHSIIALGIKETETEIYKIDIENSAITKLAGSNHFSPNLCPDGKTLVFMKAGPIIMKCNLDTGVESEVVKISPTIFGWDLSPDGREVVFQVNGVVKIVSINGGEPRELFRDLKKKDVYEYMLRWTKDGRYIIARAGSDIWRVPAMGGTPLKLDLAVPKMGAFALHPDNRNFVFSVSEDSRSELWVLENFLPK
jgi:Tol biopolymer transport system component